MACTRGAIALRPTGNTQGSHYFLNINSGRCVTWNNWMVLSMPTEVPGHPDSDGLLCTRVKNPDPDDYKKLTHIMQYLWGIQELTLRIEPDGHPNWWVESSYAVHPDMYSHSGIYLTLGKGTTYSGSSKQKLNTKSSTEAELVAIDDAMGQILWTCHFLAAQGEYVPTTDV